LTTQPTDVSADDVALILETSGTTGRPKAAMLTHNNIIYSERQFAAELGIGHDDVCFMPSPLNHATGFHHGLIMPMMLGARVVLQQDFSASAAIDLMNREKVTWSMGSTPFIFDILNIMEEKGSRIPSLRFYLCGGAPVPSDMVKRAWKHGILLSEVYGSTESVPHVFVPPSRALEWNGSVTGRALGGTKIKIVDKDGNEALLGTEGEELSKGPGVFVGYYGDRRATDDVLSDNGWFSSGDLAIMDRKERIRIVGRKKEILIRGGENLSISHIEQAVHGCPGILEEAVCGTFDPRLGERICLYVVPKPGDTLLTLDGIINYLKNKGVSRCYWPEHIEFIDAIPRTESGKIRHGMLVEDFARRHPELMSKMVEEK